MHIIVFESTFFPNNGLKSKKKFISSFLKFIMKIPISFLLSLAKEKTPLSGVPSISVVFKRSVLPYLILSCLNRSFLNFI